MSRLISTSDIRRNKWRVSMITWSIGMALNIGTAQQLKHLAFESFDIFFDFVDSPHSFRFVKSGPIHAHIPPITAGTLAPNTWVLCICCFNATHNSEKFKIPPRKHSILCSIPLIEAHLPPSQYLRMKSKGC